MRRFVVLAVLVAGCGTSTTVDKQAEDIASIAAEGALLAHDASEGHTTATFTRVHARELEKKAKKLASTIRDRRLKPVASSVGPELQTLAEHPDDEEVAAGLERSLDRLSRAAEDVGKAAS